MYVGCALIFDERWKFSWKGNRVTKDVHFPVQKFNPNFVMFFSCNSILNFFSNFLDVKKFCRTFSSEKGIERKKKIENERAPGIRKSRKVLRDKLTKQLLSRRGKQDF